MLTDFLLVWQYRTCPVLIPDVSGICPEAEKLLFSGWFVGSSDGRESRHGSGVPTSRTSTDLEVSLSWSYRTCPVFIPDVSDICPTAVKLLFSGWFVGSSDVGQEFRRSEVLVMVRSFDVSQFN